MILERVIDVVESRYREPVDIEQWFESSLDQMMRRLDEHSSYIPPRHTDDFEGETEGFFVGIGIVLEEGPDPRRIRLVLKDSPAAGAGIRRGDQIVAVDDTTLAEARKSGVPLVRLIKGPPNSTVTLTIERDSDAGVESVVKEVERRRVPIPSLGAVHLYENLDESVGYVRLMQFQTGTAAEIEEAFRGLRAAGAHRFILDLRSNPGGVLQEALEVCDLFIDKRLVLSTRGRNNVDKPDQYFTSLKTPFRGVPLVVLIDHNSASASEIVAAAIQDIGAGIVVGSESYGKWTVQDVVPIESGRLGILKLTTKKFSPPIGRWIIRDSAGRERLRPQLIVSVDPATAEAIDRAARGQQFEYLNDPLTPKKLDLPSYDDTDALVDPVLIRAASVLTSSDYDRLLESEPGDNRESANLTPPSADDSR